MQASSLIHNRVGAYISGVLQHLAMMEGGLRSTAVDILNSPSRTFQLQSSPERWLSLQLQSQSRA